MSMRRRLERLEGGGGSFAGPCPECGIDSSAPVEYFVDWEAILAEDDDRPIEESSPPCPRCGQRAVVVVDGWGIIEPEGGGQ